MATKTKTKTAELIPDAALLQHVAIVGKTGSGKTYAAKGLVERLLREGRRVCVLDPTGAWWGLRTARDGKKPGFPITIFGGERGDIPINEHAGRAVAALLAGGNVPAIIDLSDTWLAERRRFAEQFLETLFKSNRGPLHLVIDEADEFFPQTASDEGVRRLQGAVDRIVRRGRIKGFRVMMVTQRPAVLHKNALTQAGTLIAMRLPAPQDRKAVEDWIRGQGDTETGAEVMRTLAKLGQGEGWVWSPEAEILERTRFPRLETFDSSATPDDDAIGAEPAKTIAEVDTTAIEAALAESVREAEANDPAKLRRRVAALEADLEAAQRAPAVDPEEIVAAAKAEAASGTLGLVREMRPTIGEIVSRAETLSAELRSLETLLEGIAGRDGAAVNGAALAMALARPVPEWTRPQAMNGRRRDAGGDGELGTPHLAILDALAWWASVGIDRPSAAIVAMVAGYSPTGGTFARYLSTLSSAGMIDRERGEIVLRPEGAERATRPASRPTLAEFHGRLREVVRGSRSMGEPHVRILEAMIARGPAGEISAADLAAETGYSAGGGTFARYLSALSSLGLIARSRGRVEPTATLFPEGLR